MVRGIGAVLLLGLVVIVVDIPTAFAQQAPVRVEVIIDSTDLIIELVDVTTPIGAFEIEVVGLPPLSEPCQPGSGFGACSEVDGVLRVVALNVSGWSEDLVVMSAVLSEPASDGVTADAPVLADLDGVSLPVEATVTQSGVADGAGTPQLLPALIVGALLLAGAGGWFWLRVRRAVESADPLG